MTTLWFIAGLILLVVGADALVRGASRLAAMLGLSPLVIGLTVVAFGTSAPELAVSANAALSGQGSIALGNVVGSNILNVLLILGVSAVVIPLVVAQQLIRLDVPLMVVVSGLVLVAALDGVIDRRDGVLLVAGLLAYVTFLFVQGRCESASASTEAEPVPAGVSPTKPGGWVGNGALVVAGFAGLVLGSRWLVESAVIFAQWLGVSELVIGLTIVAVGTSLPEVVTSIIAAVRGERDLAVGNVVGSNMFNLLGVLGVAAVLAPGGIAVGPAVIAFDLPVMLVVAFACLPIFFTGGVISRGEGVLFLFYYAAYTLYVVLSAAEHDALEGFSMLMLYFVIPLTVVTLGVVVVQERRRHA